MRVKEIVIHCHWTLIASLLRWFLIPDYVIFGSLIFYAGGMMTTEMLTVLETLNMDKKNHNRFLNPCFIPKENSRVSFAAVKSSHLLETDSHSIHIHWNLLLNFTALTHHKESLSLGLNSISAFSNLWQLGITPNHTLQSLRNHFWTAAPFSPACHTIPEWACSITKQRPATTSSNWCSSAKFGTVWNHARTQNGAFLAAQMIPYPQREHRRWFLIWGISAAFDCELHGLMEIMRYLLKEMTGAKGNLLKCFESFWNVSIKTWWENCTFIWHLLLWCTIWGVSITSYYMDCLNANNVNAHNL